MKFSPRQTFVALSYPNYRLWFYGQITSLFGTWMQTTAQGFLVYDLTHSPAYLGFITFSNRNRNNADNRNNNIGFRLAQSARTARHMVPARSRPVYGQVGCGSGCP